MTQHELRFSAHASSDGDVVCVVLAGELDMAGVPLLRVQLEWAAEQPDCATAIDASHLTFCDVCGQRALVEAFSAGTMLVGRMPRCLEQLCELTGLGELVPDPIPLTVLRRGRRTAGASTSAWRAAPVA